MNSGGRIEVAMRHNFIYFVALQNLQVWASKVYNPFQILPLVYRVVLDLK